MNQIAEPIADSVSDAAARLGVSRSLLYVELKSGRLEALKVRGRTIVSREAQSRWLAALPRSHAS